MVLDTQRQCFKDKVDYEIFIDKEVDVNALILSNILNSMVDNCIKYGFANISYLGLITIELLKKTCGYLVAVEDNGKGKAASSVDKDQVKLTGTGLGICYQYVALLNMNRKINLLLFRILDLYDDLSCGTRCEF